MHTQQERYQTLHAFTGIMGWPGRGVANSSRTKTVVGSPVAEKINALMCPPVACIECALGRTFKGKLTQNVVNQIP